TTAMVNLSFIFMHDGNYGGADALLHEAVVIDGKISGPDSLSVANDVNNLGSLFLLEGRYDEAEALFQRSLAIWEKAPPAWAGGIAVALNNV
ncbi:tetratricopeptide repeat protein, partial [Thermoanaerobacterium sp. DL9XJH110]|uniref:tetratricopeptide repeat protein n=1 Tax=Thermoanaerobacterium sp. DL9XJH110 TaxID=3386643 RepID=UPI003BB704CF